MNPFAWGLVLGAVLGAPLLVLGIGIVLAMFGFRLG